MRCNSLLGRCGMPPLSGLSSSANTSSDPDLSRGDPMRTLYQKGVDKRQTPNPGRE